MTLRAGGPDDPRDDRELLAAHLADDAEAFGRLFARHRDRLWAVALRTTGDPEDAADSLQDAMISAFRRAGSYRGDAAVTTWLHRIVVNACLDRLRRAKVRFAQPLPDEPAAYIDGGSLATGTPRSTGTVDPLEVVLGDEQRTAVLAALDTLPADQKAALVLVDMEGYPVDEAAEILGCAPGTVKSRCSRGRARLVPLLQGLRQRNPSPPPRVRASDDAPMHDPILDPQRIQPDPGGGGQP
ncbi:MAG TPA: RNA polymerase sigma factor SigM [Nocardioidaceae bacterium]|nr:RNA polymerase sigma factor SigM [Nocardioidaceae bacterium]